MAYKKNKNYKRKSSKSKKYTIEERLEYHSKRARVPGRFNIKLGGPKHSYSDGFRESFLGHNNESAIRNEFGVKSGNAYAAGYKRGKKAANEYFLKTGENPFKLGMKY